MKNLKSLNLNATVLTKNQMKKVFGGGGPVIIHPCFKCCSSDKCSPVRHYCSDIVCPDAN